MTTEELLETYFNNRHILQSPEWGQFKTLTGARAVTANNSQLTTHQLPLTPWKVGYAPKIRPEDLDLEKLYEAARKENCLFVKLDVPHAPFDYTLNLPAQADAKRYTLRPGKPIFAQSTVLMDLAKSDDELLSGMHEKARYNLKLAQKKGVMVKIYPDDLQGQAFPRLRESERARRADSRSLSTPGLTEALDEFVRLQKETAKRQKFLIHPDNYYRTCFETLAPHGLAYLLESRVAKRESRIAETAAAWILFRYGDVLYYPYGESNYEYRSYMPSNLLMWEAIQLGKRLGCKVFDLWGAADDPNDEKDPWHGFTRFKLSFGGLHVKLAPTYDLVINPTLYSLFNLADDLRWKILRFLRG